MHFWGFFFHWVNYTGAFCFTIESGQFTVTFGAVFNIDFLPSLCWKIELGLDAEKVYDKYLVWPSLYGICHITALCP